MQSNLDYLVSSMLVHSPGTNIRLISTINRSILPAGLGARGVSSEHVENMENAEKMENMEMFSGSPTEMYSGSPTEMFFGSPT